jgi:glycosyltransferase involved in cell wall biosynthesis
MESSTKSESPHRDGSSLGDAVRQVTYIGNFLSVHGLNPTYAEALVPRLRSCGFKVVASSSRLNGVHRFLDMVWAVAITPRQRACVIIDLYSGPRAYGAAVAVAQLCRVLRKPYIVVLHGGNLPQRLQSSRASLLSMLRGAALVTSPSAYLAQSFEGRLPVSVIPNALDISAYPFRLRSSVLPRCLYLRAFHRFLDPMTAIRAFALVKRQHANAILRMVGPDEDGTLARCHGLVSELGLEKSVEFSGRIPKAEIPGLGNSFDVFINSSLVDNTPLSTIEAMAMGLCIVATTVGGLPYLLEHGKTALMVPPGDAQRMGDAILTLITDAGFATQLSRQARVKAETMDWSFILPFWREAINRACGSRAG